MMAACKSTPLTPEACAMRSKRYIDLRCSGSESRMCSIACKAVLTSRSRCMVRSRRGGLTRNTSQGGRKKVLKQNVRFPLLHGTEVSLWSRKGCAVNDKNHAPVVFVSDDDLENHRKLLERFFNEQFEAISREIEWNDEEVEDEEESSGRFLHPYTMVKWEQDLEELEEDIPWWRKLNFPSQLTPRTRGIILLNMLTFLYGSNIAVIKSAGAVMDPSLFSVARFAVASLVFTPFLPTAISNKKLRDASAELGVWASMGYLTQCVAVLTSDAARVSFISTFTVLVVPLLAGLSGTKITKITWGSAFAALVGVALLEANGTPPAIGDAWSFVSAIMFGVHMLRTEQLSTNLSTEDCLPIISLQLVLITTCSAMWSLASHFNLDALRISNLHAVNWSQLLHQAAGVPWLSILYTGLLTTAFCLWCELISLRDVKATEAAVIYTLEPLWGAAFAWILMGERWGPNGWVGATFILGGCLTMQLFGHPQSLHKEMLCLPEFKNKGSSTEEAKRLRTEIELPEVITSNRI